MRRAFAAIGALVIVLGTPLRASGETVSLASVVRNANGSGIALSHQVEPSAQASGAARITLRFAEVTDPSGASFRVVPDAGLVLAKAVETQTLSAGQTTTVVIDVVQRGEATGYLNVFTTQRGSTSVVSIAVQVGKLPAGLPGRGTLKQLPDGEKISPILVK
jgi:hypothetical protein